MQFFNWLMPKKAPASGGMFLSGVTINAHGESIDAEKALRNPAVFRSIDILARTIANLPWSVTEDVSDTFSPVDHPVNKLLRRPNKGMTPYELKFRIVTDLMIHGNCFLLKVKSSDKSTRFLVPLDPTQVRAEATAVGSNKFHYADQEYSEDEIIFIRDFLSLNVAGLSRVQQCAELINQSSKLDAGITNNFKSASSLSGVVMFPENVEPEDAAKFQAAWAARFGPNSTEPSSVAVLGNGATFTQMKPQSAADSEMQDMLKVEMARIAGIFGVPASMLEAPTDGTKYNNMSQKNTSFYRDTIQPMVKNIGMSMAYALVEGDGFTIGFDPSELLKGDAKAAMEVASTAYTSGIWSREESRVMTGKPASAKEGDTFNETPSAPNKIPSDYYEAESTGEYGPRE